MFLIMLYLAAQKLKKKEKKNDESEKRVIEALCCWVNKTKKKKKKMGVEKFCFLVFSFFVNLKVLWRHTVGKSVGQGIESSQRSKK